MRMPLRLRNEFIDYLFADEIEHFSVFFTDYNHQLKYSLMLQMYPRIFEENALIIKNGIDVDEIYIVRRGKVYLQTSSNTSFLALSEKSFFGEEFALFGRLPKIDFLAGQYGVEAFCLKKSKYIELLNQYPKTFQYVLRRAFKRAKYFKAVMFAVTKNEQLDSEDYTTLSRSATFRATTYDFSSSFNWELTKTENDELNTIIMSTNEITVKEKICENLKKNQNSISSIHEHVEKITTKMEELKNHYEKDIEDLVYAINLLKDGHGLEANDLISRITSKNQIT